MKTLNTRNKVIYPLLFSTSLFVVFSSNCYGDGLCTGKDETLVCLKKYSIELYSTNDGLGPTSPSAVTVTLFAKTLPLIAGIYSFEQRALTVNAPEFICWISRYQVDLIVVGD